MVDLGFRCCQLAIAHMHHSVAIISGGITLSRTEEQKLSILDNVYITHRIVGYTQTIDCKSVNLVCVPCGDRMKLWS